MLNWLAEILFPERCMLCGFTGSLVCQNCWHRLACENNKLFRKDIILSGESSLPIYSCRIYDPASGWVKLIWRLKYKFSRSLAGLLSEQLYALLLKKQLSILQTAENSVLVPVPSDFWRQRWRGFNQAELLARELSHRTGIPYGNILSRHRPIRSQAKSTGKQRRQNLQNTMKLIGSLPDNCLNIILVDDVATTGSTLREAWRVLRLHYAQKNHLAVCLASRLPF